MTEIKQNYLEILEDIKKCFPSPISDPIMDGYLVHTISHFLDHIDDLKCVAPVLGVNTETCLDGTLHNVDTEKIPMLHKKVHTEIVYTTQYFPDKMSSVEDVTELLMEYCKNMIIWGHGNTQVNVIPPSTIPSVVAFIASAIYNPNMIWDEYSGGFADAEIHAVSMLSNIIGYDQERSGGIFTFGGTGANLYGCKLGIEKMFGGTTMKKGIREDVKIVASDVSHYSKLNVASWLGLGTDNIVNIPTNENSMFLEDLENYLRHAFESGEKVGVILATLGTTDSFGIDDIEGIKNICDKLTIEYELDHPPFIHADAAIGWPWIVFKDYDFESNQLGFHKRTLLSLKDSIGKIRNMYMADSIGIDFHKIGYGPYISSVFMVKERNDLTLLSRAPEQMPYLYQFGHYHPGIYTLESSRSAGGAMAALANIKLLGKNGYRVLIGHIVEMTEMLRDRLEKYPFIKILNGYNYGPVTIFRIYPPNLNASETFQRELTVPDYKEQLEENNIYNFHIFKYTYERAMQGEGVLLSWTDAYRYTDYSYGPRIAGLKSFIMSPWTDINAIDKVIKHVIEAELYIEKTRK